jgi:hypothetical protein
MPNLFTRGVKNCAVQIKGYLPARKGLLLEELSRVGIIQDYEDKKKQYHNLEKDYVVQGSHPRFLILRPTLPKPLIATRAVMITSSFAMCLHLPAREGRQYPGDLRFRETPAKLLRR